MYLFIVNTIIVIGLDLKL